jgi:hypothetical protein
VDGSQTRVSKRLTGQFDDIFSQIPPPERWLQNVWRRVWESALLIRRPKDSDAIGLQTTLSKSWGQ